MDAVQHNLNNARPYCECGHCRLELLPRTAWLVAGHGDLNRLAVLPGHEKHYVDCYFEIEDFGSWLAIGDPVSKSFPTENAVSGENGGGGNRTRVTSPAESPSEQEDRPRPCEELA